MTTHKIDIEGVPEGWETRCNQHFRDGLILTQQPKYWRIKEE